MAHTDPIMDPYPGLKEAPVGTTTAWCSLCGKTGITFPHSCYPVSDITKIEPNRFDPFEALDLLHDLVDGEVPGKAGSEPIHAAIIALRAYITGMEP